MPIYEYRCSSCGHQLETLQKFSDPPLVECPHCHRPDLAKLVSAVGFQLKGSGWYVTDFRNSGARPAAPARDAAAGATDGAPKDQPATEAGANGADRPAVAAGERSAAVKSAADNASEGSSTGNAKPESKSPATGGASSAGPTPDSSR